jgi:hypothetical protein
VYLAKENSSILRTLFSKSAQLVFFSFSMNTPSTNLHEYFMLKNFVEVFNRVAANQPLKISAVRIEKEDIA